MSGKRKHVLVLGGGLIGKTIALDLADRFCVTVADANLDTLQKLECHEHITGMKVDFTNLAEIRKLAFKADIVVGAMPGQIAFSALRAVIEAGKNVVDISFFEEDPFELGALAKTHGVTVVVDMGVAPGMSNFLLGYEGTLMDVVRFECLVGGLPVVRELPSEYKAPFAPESVMDEYMRPARIVVGGRIFTKPALSEPELVHFPEVGTLEAFNTDGLRTLLALKHVVPNMIEKTMRYPRHHREMMEMLKAAGFFSQTPVEVRGVSVAPMDVTARILKDQWKLGRNEDEFTAMRLTMEGCKLGKSCRTTYHLLDRRDRETGTSSMARTTGYACTAVATLLLDGKIKEKGVIPPEHLGVNENHVRFVMEYLHQRGVIYKKKEAFLE
ncbi:MAG: saccharopine dehydrogenase family protein [Patescibacteria group bacterium]|nr:MAG: saccharopine dehydrogenase family protein [Patescibacteria group bacterium]